MKRTKIAPLLTAMVAEYAKHRDLDMHGRTWAEAQRELQVLMSIARAVGRDGKPFADDEGPACICGPCRAYARLVRLSRKRGERGGKGR